MRGSLQLSVPLMFWRSGVLHVAFTLYRLDGAGVALSLIELPRCMFWHWFVPAPLPQLLDDD